MMTMMAREHDEWDGDEDEHANMVVRRIMIILSLMMIQKMQR